MPRHAPRKRRALLAGVVVAAAIKRVHLCTCEVLEQAAVDRVEALGAVIARVAAGAEELKQLLLVVRALPALVRATAAGLRNAWCGARAKPSASRSLSQLIG
eukprot:362519-Chlamydomonas_euryale.AAC.2